MTVRSTAGRVRRRARDVLRGETAATYFDLADRAAVDAVLADSGLPPGRPGPTASGVARVRRIYEVRQDLRAAFPLGRTPHPQRAAYLRWLLTFGRADFGVTAGDVLAATADDDAAPDRGLEVTYRLTPAWQRAVPDALTPAGWPRFLAYLRDEYGLASRWVRRARLGPQPTYDLSKPGVNVVAHYRYPSGLQEAAVGLDRALARGGCQVCRRDLPLPAACDWADATDYRGLDVFGTTFVVAAANTFPDEWLPRAGLHWRPGGRRIAVWYWELDRVPAEWAGRLGWPTEVWAPTEFVAEGFRRAVPWVPVRVVLPGVDLPPFVPRPRGYFGLPEGFLFLFTFDMGSVMARKNPLAVLAAFRAAFPGGQAGVHLAIKVSRGEANRADLAALRAEVAATPNAALIDAVLPRPDAVALLDSADCFVSLHRAEGLGLSLAESMLLGKPVIATGYSGNREFMTPDTARLIAFSRVPVGPKCDPYPADAEWAEPDVTKAAAAMCESVADPAAARALGARAKRHAEAVLSPAAYAARVAAALSGRPG